jgi:hypothetical protein
LRTGVAAPKASTDCGEQEQRQRADEQQAGQVDEVLRIQHGAEQIKATLNDVEQHCGALVPGEPGQAVEDQLRDPDHRPAPACEQATDCAWINLASNLVEVDFVVDSASIRSCVAVAWVHWRVLEAAGFARRVMRERCSAVRVAIAYRDAVAVPERPQT